MANNCNVIKKGDVLWVPYRRDPLWPALVQNVYPKKITYLFFPLPEGEEKIRSVTFSCHPKSTYALVFNERLPKKANKDLREAYQSACNYLTENGLTRGSLIDERREGDLEDSGSPELIENTPEAEDGNSVGSNGFKDEKIEEEENGKSKETTNKEGKRKKSYSSGDKTDSDQILAVKKRKLESKKRRGSFAFRNLAPKEQKYSFSTPFLSFSEPSSSRPMNGERAPSVSASSSGRAPSTSSAYSSSSLCNGSSVPPSTEQRRFKAKSMSSTLRSPSKSSVFSLPPLNPRLLYRSPPSMPLETTSKDMMMIINDNIDRWFNEIWESNRVQFYKQPDRDELVLNLKNNQCLISVDYDLLVERLVVMVRKRNIKISLIVALHLTTSVIIPYIMISCWAKYKSIPFEKAVRVYDTTLNSLQGKHNITNCGLRELCRVACEARASLMESS